MATCVTHAAIAGIGAERWREVAGKSHPFTRYEWLEALESSGCVGGDSGWEPCHFWIEGDGDWRAALPGYRKYHSYGEYVFDWRWAEASVGAGIAYYPKQLFAIPFTPVPGPRLLSDRPVGELPVAEIARAISAQVRAQGGSGWHVLFPAHDQLSALAQTGLLHRQDVQFVWRNEGYRDFDDFLDRLRASKRKQVRRERRRVAGQGISLERLTGADIAAALDHFCDCYRETYRRRSGHDGYLNPDFFARIADSMHDQLMLAVARQHGRPVAAALFLYDRETLYGRYWGALAEVDCLHFELCYYQGIEHAIEAGLTTFNPGTQGEHKLARGFAPVVTSSLHWFADPRLSEAIADYLHRERAAITHYRDACAEHLPFRQFSPDGKK